MGVNQINTIIDYFRNESGIILLRDFGVSHPTESMLQAENAGVIRRKSHDLYTLTELGEKIVKSNLSYDEFIESQPKPVDWHTALKLNPDAIGYSNTPLPVGGIYTNGEKPNVKSVIPPLDTISLIKCEAERELNEETKSEWTFDFTQNFVTQAINQANRNVEKKYSYQERAKPVIQQSLKRQEEIRKAGEPIILPPTPELTIWQKIINLQDSPKLNQRITFWAGVAGIISVLIALYVLLA